MMTLCKSKDNNKENNYNKNNDNNSHDTDQSVQSVQSVQWYMHTSYEGLLSLAAILSTFHSKDLFRIYFQTCPTHVSLYIHADQKKVVIKTDGVILKTTCTPLLVASANENVLSICNGYKHVPHNFRYGAYIVDHNSIFYKKDYLHYPSVPYEIDKKPVMRNLTPRESISYEFSIC